MGAPTEEEKPTCGQKCSTGCTGFKTFLYNPNAPDPHSDDPNQTRALYMGRTGKSWAKIGLFYLVFYGFLAGFFSAMLAVFLTTVNSPSEGGPKLTQFIVNQPGLGRVDMLIKENEKKGILRLELPYTQNSSRVHYYSKFITEYLNKFDVDTDNNRAKCNSSDIGGYEGDNACIFDWKTELGDCANSSNNYGFDVKKPCFFIKINKVYNWVPKASTEGGKYLTLSCDKGTVYPEGFLIAGFPFRGQKDYMAPVVAVQIDATEDGDGAVVICKLEGKDIDVSDSVVVHRAYGKIRVKDVKMKPSS